MAMSFPQAEAYFWQIKGKLAAGQINQEAYEAALKQLMIQDGNGRWWTPQRDTGQWLVYDGANWIPAAPPGLPPTAPPPPTFEPSATAYQQAVQAAARPQASAGTGGKTLMWLVFTAGFWTVVAGVVFVATSSLDYVAGVAAAGAISLVFVLRTMTDNWEGVVERMETRRVRRGDIDSAFWEDVQVAVIRLTNGRTKTLNAISGWHPGDRLVKRRGDATVRKG